MKSRLFQSLVVGLCFLAGCETMPEGIQEARLAAFQRIQAEPPGNYFIGRRYYKQNFHFWGYIRARSALEHRATGDVERK